MILQQTRQMTTPRWLSSEQKIQWTSFMTPRFSCKSPQSEDLDTPHPYGATLPYSLSTYIMHPSRDTQSIDTIFQISIRLDGIAYRENHCHFLIGVETTRYNYMLYKRYTHFRALRLELEQIMRKLRHCRKGPCRQICQWLDQLNIPRRSFPRILSKAGRESRAIRVALSRAAHLESFMQLLLSIYQKAPKRQQRCCIRDNCPVLCAIHSFFNQYDEVSKEKLVSEDCRRRTMTGGHVTRLTV